MKINEYNCAVKHFLQNNALIYTLLSKYSKIELKTRRNYFPSLTTSIIGQQLSIYSARAIIIKFNSYFDNKVTPEKIFNSNLDVLRSLGLSKA